MCCNDKANDHPFVCKPQKEYLATLSDALEGSKGPGLSTMLKLEICFKVHCLHEINENRWNTKPVEASVEFISGNHVKGFGKVKSDQNATFQETQIFSLCPLLNVITMFKTYGSNLTTMFEKSDQCLCAASQWEVCVLWN